MGQEIKRTASKNLLFIDMFVNQTSTEMCSQSLDHRIDKPLQQAFTTLITYHILPPHLQSPPWLLQYYIQRGSHTIPPSTTKPDINNQNPKSFIDPLYAFTPHTFTPCKSTHTHTHNNTQKYSVIQKCNTQQIT